MRIGLVIPRLKQTAVARNRLKRQLRELSRLRLLPLDLPVDAVVRIHGSAYTASFDALAGDIERIVVQLRRWHQTLVTSPVRDAGRRTP